MILFTVPFVSNLYGSDAIKDGWQVKFGNKPEMVSFYNANSDKNFKEDASYGPLSFKVFKDKLWLLDSIGGRVIVLGKEEKPQIIVEIPDLSKNAILEDFAVVRTKNGIAQSVWVAEADSRTIRKISLASGKELARIKKADKNSFIQIHQLEVDATGRLYVGDYGRAKIYIFTPYGKLVRELPWQLSDFAVDQYGHLYNLNYTEGTGYFLQVYMANGSIARNIHIGLPDLKSGRIISITDSGGILAAFTPVSGFHGTLKLIEISRFGAIGQVTEITPTLPMNRFAYFDGKSVWNMISDYDKAPKGFVNIQKVNWK